MVNLGRSHVEVRWLRRNFTAAAWRPPTNALQHYLQPHFETQTTRGLLRSLRVRAMAARSGVSNYAPETGDQVQFARECSLVLFPGLNCEHRAGRSGGHFTPRSARFFSVPCRAWAGFLYGPWALSPPASPQLGQASAAVLGCKRSSRASPCQPQVHDQEVTERPVLRLRRCL
jgi:hypothetical protein